MQILETNNNIISDDIRFKTNVKNLYALLLSRHNELMNIWKNDNAEEIIRSLGKDAKGTFETSYLLQQTLKIANPEYEFIRPYKLVQEEVTIMQDFDVLDEEGHQTYDEDGNPVKESRPVKSMESSVVYLQPTFKADGSLDTLNQI